MVLSYIRSLFNFNNTETYVDNNTLSDEWKLEYYYDNNAIDYLTHPTTISYVIIISSYYTIFKICQKGYYIYKNPKKYLLKIPILRDSINNTIKHDEQ